MAKFIDYLNKNYLLKDPVGKTIFSLGSLTIVLLFAFFLVVIPRTKEVLSKREELVSLQKKYREIKDKASWLASWDWEESEKKAKLTQLAFPTKKDIYLVIFALQEPCRRNGFLIEKMSFDLGEIESEAATAAATSSTNELDSVKIELAASGRKEGLNSLLNDLDESLPLIAVEDFSFSGSDDSGDLGIATMHLKMFFISRPSELKKADQVSPKDLEFTPQELETIAEIENYYNKASSLYQRLYFYPEIQIGQEVTVSGERGNPFAPL